MIIYRHINRYYGFYKMNIFRQIEKKFRIFRKNIFYKNLLKNEFSQINTEIKQIKAHINNLKYELSDEIINNNGRNIKIPKVMSIEQTIQEILDKKLSVCRYGDGEFYTIIGQLDSITYYNQILDKTLQDKLRLILTQRNPKILTCIWDLWGSLENFDEATQKGCVNTLFNVRDGVYKYIDFNLTYGNAFISRPYMCLKDKSKASEYFNLLKQIWNNKNIIIVEGEGSRLGVGNDLFDNAASIQRIICPAENAYSKYNTIFQKCLQIDRNKLILIALGMTATVLAYELAELGYQAIDIGHIDIEYEWYLKGVSKNIDIIGKYVNDIGKHYFEPIQDDSYTNSIIERICLDS